VASPGFLEMPGFEMPLLLVALAGGAAVMVLRKRR
jgi:hypothetical protein